MINDKHIVPFLIICAVLKIDIFVKQNLIKLINKSQADAV